ncbi:MAG: polynucleotide adenylyltransferase PcnB [Parachlamydia sp.]|nr:polynucleotide adenylyltransferase PcnB [Parachlamydia sp.]
MKPIIYSSREHSLDPSLVDPDALHVIHKLKEAGHSAYLVGGGVRDLLLKRKPKDFDISTSALPEEVKQIFRRSCILIGRRFRLAHVRFGHKVIEVATFRAGENEGDLIVQDNVWGTAEGDALRRDFTINGLFYDPETHEIIDYVGGWHDLQAHTLKIIGHPETRFKQDPVRMIRLLKFRARFGFEIDDESRRALAACREEIVKSSPARLLEEILRMLESGASAPFFMLMHEAGLLEQLLPPVSHYLHGPHADEVFKFLSAADRFHAANPKITLDRAILMSCLLFPILETEVRNHYLNKGLTPHIGDIMMLTSTLLRAVLTASFSHFPRRISTTANFILTTQYRLTTPSGKRQVRPRLFRIKEFELALKFLKIRAIADEQLLEDYAAWKALYQQHTHHAHHKGHPPPRTRRRPR